MIDGVEVSIKWARYTIRKYGKDSAWVQITIKENLKEEDWDMLMREFE